MGICLPKIIWDIVSCYSRLYINEASVDIIDKYKNKLILYGGLCGVR
jgi:hypothetical protein